MYEIAIAVIPIAIAVCFLSWKKSWDRKPPGPDKTFLLGNVKDIERGRVHQSLHRLSQKHGHIMHIRLLHRNIVVLSNVKLIRKAFTDLEYKDILNDKPKGFFGTHMLYNNQDVLFAPLCDRTFKLKNIIHAGLQQAMSAKKTQEEAKLMMENFRDVQGNNVNPRHIIGEILADFFAFILRGSAEPDDSGVLWEFTNQCNELLRPSNEGVLKIVPWLRFVRCTPAESFRLAREARDALTASFLDDYRLIKEQQLKKTRMECSRSTCVTFRLLVGKEIDRKGSSYSPDVTRGVVDMCLRIQSTDRDVDGTCWLTDDMIKCVILDTVGAGLTAMTNSTLATILNLVHHPKCIDKMVAEINTVVGRDRLPEWNDVMRMPYCHAVILESFRYSSLVPIVNHICSKSDIEFEGYTIPKDTIVFGNFWSAHRDATLWKDPLSFDPGRFLDSKGSLLPLDHELRKSLIPFGIGCRTCSGDVMAKHKLFVYVTTLVQHFEILPPEDEELLSCDPDLYLSGPVLQVPSFACRFISRPS